MTNARGNERRIRGSSKPEYGMSMPLPMAITAMLTGGAVAPNMPPRAMNAPALTLGMPISIRIGQTRTPALMMAAVDEPVIIPGNMTTTIRHRSNSAGNRWNFRMMALFMSSSVPEF